VSEIEQEFSNEFAVASRGPVVVRKRTRSLLRGCVVRFRTTPNGPIDPAKWFGIVCPISDTNIRSKTPFSATPHRLIRFAHIACIDGS